MGNGDLSNKKEKAGSKIGRILNSAMAFVIAYLVIMFFFYFSTAVMGKLFGFDAQVYYYGVKFQLGRHKWTTGNVFWIWSCGTFVTVFLGVICTYLYHNFKERIVLGNLVTLWGSIIAFSIAAAQGLLPILDSGNDRSFFYTNLSIVFAYWNLPTSVLYIICIIFLLLLAMVSANIARYFLSFSYSFSKVNKRERKRKYYFETVLVPYVLASAILLAFFQQTYRFVGFDMQNVVYLAVIGVVLILSMLVVNISDIKSDDVLRYKNLQQISAALFVIMMILLVFLSVTWQGFYLPF